MQEQIQIDITRLQQENELLRRQIEENEARIRSLQHMLPNEPRPPAEAVLMPEVRDVTVASAPRPEGDDIVPAITYRDETGTLRIGLCRTNNRYTYVPVADGWAREVPLPDGWAGKAPSPPADMEID